jgi:hypothetical protein
MQVAPLASCAESEAADQYDSNSEARAYSARPLVL